MYTVTILENLAHKGSVVIEINESKFTVRKSPEFLLNEFPSILVELKTGLINIDTEKIHNIITQNQILAPTLWRFMEHICTKEFEQYCAQIYKYFLDSLNKTTVSPRTVIKLIKFNDIEKALTAKLSMGKELLDEIQTPNRVLVHLLNGRFLQFIEACEKDDIKSIRKLAPSLGDQLLIDRIYADDHYKHTFESFVKRVGNQLFIQKKDLSKIEIARYIFKESIQKRDVGGSLNKIGRLPIFKEVATELHNKIAQLPHFYSFEDDIWIIKSKDVQGFRSYKLDFSILSEEDKKHFKMYIETLLNKTATKYSSIYTAVYGVTTLMKRFNELPYKNITSILEINYYHLLHLLDYLQQIKKDDGKDLYNIPSIYNLFQQARIFIDWYIDNIDLQQNNNFREIQMNNIKSFGNNTRYIPEEVVGKLENVVHELPETYLNAWTLMMNTGIRISDVKALTIDCITYDQDLQIYLFTYLNVKMESYRVKTGESKYHTIPVSNLVAEIIERQKVLSAELRTDAQTDKLFLVRNKHSEVVSIQGRGLARSINRLIRKYNILDFNGEHFQYTNHQCRKTVIVDLLSKGHSLKKVADYINHSEKTAAKYYRDVEMKKIAELDRDLFKQLFEDMLTPEIQNQYTENEKQSLFKEIKLGARETPEGHGVCVKHVAFGPCQKKKCVGCKMLISGPQKLPMWYNLYNEQEAYLKDLEKQFRSTGINNFTEHRLYQQEQHLLKVYLETINKIENFATERGISIEQYRQ